ncbi:hypothetical protein [Mucilaginibacter sp. dw_454]|uniref:hypothetical protein n=1 Tax=Mucilaginibacter sp. dw_454 TaxID=2720079 RepID=UPI001BD26677|nr:hypothetical protein [Mucilaginibacter sp. dw_454]
MAIPSPTDAQTPIATITGNSVNVDTFQSGDNTYFHSVIQTSVSIEGFSLPTITSEYYWAVNTSTGVPATGAGSYQQSVFGHTVDSGLNTNDQIQLDHQLMTEVTTGATVSNYVSGEGSLLEEGISYGYGYYGY